MKTIVKERGITTINLLGLTEIKTDVYCEMKFKSNEEINKELGVDADYIKINPSDNHNGCVSCDMVLTKENKQGCIISETYIYGTLNDSSVSRYSDEFNYLEFEFDEEDKEGMYTNQYVQDDYKYSHSKSKITSSIPSFDIDKIKEFKNVMNDLQNEGFFEEEHDKDFEDKYNEAYDKLIDFQEELNKFLGGSDE